MLRGIRPITVTVKSRKSLQLGWTNVPNQLANIGCCLRAASLLDSLLLVSPYKSCCCCFFYFVCSIPSCGLLFCTMQREKKREKKDVELTEKSFQSKGKQCLSFGRVFAQRERTQTLMQSGCVFNLRNTTVEHMLLLSNTPTPTLPLPTTLL